MEKKKNIKVIKLPTAFYFPASFWHFLAWNKMAAEILLSSSWCFSAAKNLNSFWDFHFLTTCYHHGDNNACR